MVIHSVFSDQFKPFGYLHDCPNIQELAASMKKQEMFSKVCYEASIKELEECSIFDHLQKNVFGGIDIQIGLCWGKNKKLNCLEYHKNSEINIGDVDFVLMVAEKKEIKDGVLDTSKVKAFMVPAFQAVELYSTTLHYAPATLSDDGFRVAIVLPKGTNTKRPHIKSMSLEDSMLFAKNKWLLAHPDSNEAKENAYVGLTGDNIDLSKIAYVLED